MDRLRGIAGEVADRRIAEVIGSVGRRLEQEQPEVINRAKEPDFHFALLNVERAYAATGDADLADQLMDMLMERTREDGRTLVQIVLGEALIALPKLTLRMVDGLTIVFLYRHVKFAHVQTINDYVEEFSRNVLPFLKSWPFSFGEVQHIAYTGCGTLDYSSLFDLAGHVNGEYKPLHGLNRTAFDAAMRGAHPLIDHMMEEWGRSGLPRLALNSVGIAIAHAHWRRMSGGSADLRVWIDEAPTSR